MAKLTAPILSLRASGSITPDLVLRHSRGGSIVRAHGPNTPSFTTSQLTQRTRYRNALTAWSTANLTALDLTAWRLTATRFPGPATALNAFIAEHIRVAKINGVWESLRLESHGLTTPTNFRIRVFNNGSAQAHGGFGAWKPSGPWERVRFETFDPTYRWVEGTQAQWKSYNFACFAVRDGGTRWAPTGIVRTPWAS